MSELKEDEDAYKKLHTHAKKKSERMADPQGKNRLQEFKYKGKDQDVSS